MLHCVLLAHGAACMGLLLKDVVVAGGLLDAEFYEPATGRTLPASRGLLVQYLLGSERGLCGLFSLCAGMGLVLGVFDVLSSACGVVAPLYGGIVTGRAGSGAMRPDSVSGVWYYGQERGGKSGL